MAGVFFLLGAASFVIGLLAIQTIKTDIQLQIVITLVTAGAILAGIGAVILEVRRRASEIAHMLSGLQAVSTAIASAAPSMPDDQARGLALDRALVGITGPIAARLSIGERRFASRQELQEFLQANPGVRLLDARSAK